MVYLIATILFSLFKSSHAQRIEKIDIQYVTLTDTILRREIKALIKREEELDSVFAAGYGYIQMYFSFERRDGRQIGQDRIDTVFSYYLQTSTISPDKRENKLDDLYPNYYSVLENRVIMITVDKGVSGRYFGFSERSKLKLLRKLRKYFLPDLSSPGSGFRRETRVHFLRSISSNKPFDYYVTENVVR